MKRLFTKVISYAAMLSFVVGITSTSVSASDECAAIWYDQSTEESQIIGRSTSESCIYWESTSSPEDYWASGATNYWNECALASDFSISKLGRSNLLPNMLVIDFTATSTSVAIKFTNYGIDAIDYVKGTVTTGSSTKSYQFSSIKPGTTVKTISTNMLKCKEDISVYTVAVEGGSTIGSSTTTGIRTLPVKYTNEWNRGTASSVQANINAQFKKHKVSLGHSNILAFAVSASNFRDSLSSSASKTAVSGINNCFRYKTGTKFIEVTGSLSTGSIAAYGSN